MLLRRILIGSTVLTIVLSVGWWFRPKTDWITGPVMDVPALEAAANAGDPVAMYTLTLAEPNDGRRHALLLRSAELGHPPAMLTLASQLLMADPARIEDARAWLERAAQLRYGPAAAELALCLDDGACGRAAPVSILKWAIASRLFTKGCPNQRKDVESLERRLTATLPPADVELARKAAQTISERQPSLAASAGDERAAAVVGRSANPC